jgi:prepilin-type N-terminal cleavage/methylation domain-containing protein
LGIAFDALGKQEKAAVAAHVRAKYDKLISLQPPTYVSGNAQSDPDAWQAKLCELIACDPKRVQALMDYARRDATRNINGFTLIELSIVLVIIGLIVGGVLVGQDLIRSAALQTIITDKDKYVTAVNTFRTKYNEIPGDMADATTYWGVQLGNASDNYTASCYNNWANSARSPATCNGNGNGIIAYTAGCGTLFESQIFCNSEYFEQWLVWQHLSNAGLIQGSYTGDLGGMVLNSPYITVGVNIPASRADANAGFSLSYLCPTSNGALVFLPFACGHIFFYGAQSPVGNGNGADLNMYPTLTALDAQRIDQKIDDGSPATGSVTALPNGNGGWVQWAPNCTTTADPATSVYNISTGGPQCSLMFSAGF